MEARRWFAYALACLAFSLGVAELLGVRTALPSSTWRVPRRWQAYGDRVFSALFGASLGPGFLTAVPFGGYYVLLACMAFVGQPVEAAVVMAFFGFLRGVPVAAAAVALSMTGDSRSHLQRELLQGFEFSDRTSVRWLRCASLLVTSVVLLTA
jgi:hypothetical protein